MLKKERQAYILHQVNLHNKVLSSLLCSEIQVSEDTIRRDLQELADEGKVIKVHGGALSHSFNQVYFPPNGVYFAEARLDGGVYPGVVNLGCRPTMSSGSSDRVLEVYLLDFDRDIYGKDLELRFIRYLRQEKKFESVEALVQQIERDVQQAREFARMKR